MAASISPTVVNDSREEGTLSGEALEFSTLLLGVFGAVPVEAAAAPGVTRLLLVAALSLPGALCWGAPLDEAFTAYQAGDYPRAVALFRQAAEAGDSVAQYNLGLLYQDGKGVPQDNAQAAGWLRKAAERGDAKAQNELGVMLAAGRGVPRDREAAIAWFRKAVDFGDADARHNLDALLGAARAQAPPSAVLGGWGPAAAGLALVLIGVLAVPWARDAFRRPAGAGLVPRGVAAVPMPELPAASPGPGSGPPCAGLAGGKYELRGRIGEGGMGVVLEGFDRALGRRVAVKVLRPEFKTRPKDRSRFLQEARIVSHLSHPYIVGVHDILEEGGELYLILEYVDGRPLSRVLDSAGRLGLPECVKILDHVCQAVSSAHRGRVLHRDLKPSNIMLDSGGFAKVMDFGLAREAKDSISKLTQADASGTPAYMAPEQHLGHSRRASDVYSLGVCLYEMLTGELPFKGPDFLAQKERMKYPPPTFIAPELPRSLDVLMAAALAAAPEDRIADPLDLLERLRSAAA